MPRKRKPRFKVILRDDPTVSVLKRVEVHLGDTCLIDKARCVRMSEANAETFKKKLEAR